jgi:hypothetical protein
MQKCTKVHFKQREKKSATSDRPVESAINQMFYRNGIVLLRKKSSVFFSGLNRDVARDHFGDSAWLKKRNLKYLGVIKYLGIASCSSRFRDVVS